MLLLERTQEKEKVREIVEKMRIASIPKVAKWLANDFLHAYSWFLVWNE